MRVNDVEVKRTATLGGVYAELTIVTDNIPARALLNREEALMVAALLDSVARSMNA